MKQDFNSRRKFIRASAALSGALLFNGLLSEYAYSSENKNTVPVHAHLWVYASRYPPDWDCTPILDEVFSDLKYAGLDGVELMEVLLRHDDAVKKFNDLIQKHQLPVSGSSYYGDMWNKSEHQKILEDTELI